MDEFGASWTLPRSPHRTGCFERVVARRQAPPPAWTANAGPGPGKRRRVQHGRTRHELTEDYERSDGQFFSVALAGTAAGQPGSTGLGLANEGGITIEMSDSQASWQDRPYQQEVTMTNPPSWGYDLAGGEAARFIELSGQMASREQAGIEQDEAGQAAQPRMTPSAEKRASGRPWPHRRRHVRAVRPGCPGPGQRRARTPRRGGAGHGVLLEGRGARRAAMRAAARRYRASPGSIPRTCG
jgi:hypothetical protein